MDFLAELSAVDVATLTMSGLGLVGGVISTVITMNAKYYEDQRQLRITVGDLAQKILALRAEEQLLNIKALRKQEGMEEFTAARDNNMRSQQTLARLMIDMLEQLKRPATGTEYEVLASALTANGDQAGDKYWRLAIDRAANQTARLSLMGQHAYALVRHGREADGERVFKQALDVAGANPALEGYVHEARAKALHAIRRLNEARAAFDAARASYTHVADQGSRETSLQNLASARETVGLV